jgi:transcriptional regulator with XRE-family HTH domain
MSTRDDRRDAGRRRGYRIQLDLGVEWRELRLTAGLPQRTVARAIGVSRSTLSRIERSRMKEITIVRAAVLTSVLGGELSVRIYPNGQPLRDAAHVRLLERFESIVSASYRIRHEAPMPIAGDARAWDRRLDGPVSIGVEAETVLRDVQALERRMTLKQRDSGVTHMVLVVRGTQRNRALVRAMLPVLRRTFALGTAEVLAALRAGRDPGSNGLVLL